MAPVENEWQDRGGRKKCRDTAAYIADVRQDFPLLFGYCWVLQVDLFIVNKVDKLEGKWTLNNISWLF